MSLRFALLSLLLDGDATGYDLAKRFDASVANFWHALPQQLYQELARMEDDDLVIGEEVVQTGRPNKRIFSITPLGRAALSTWIDEPADLRTLKDELLIKIYGADLKAPDEIAVILASNIAPHAEKLAAYEALDALLRNGRSETDYLRSTRRIGPYLTLKRGLMYERENLAWLEWAVKVMSGRVSAARSRGTRKEPSDPATVRRRARLRPSPR